MKSAMRIAFEKWWFANRTKDNSAETEFSAYSFNAGYEAGWEACRLILNPVIEDCVDKIESEWGEMSAPREAYAAIDEARKP